MSACRLDATTAVSKLTACTTARGVSVLLQIKRTEGVSTTDIVGRMLTCTRVNPHMNKAQDNVSSVLLGGAVGVKGLIARISRINNRTACCLTSPGPQQHLLCACLRAAARQHSRHLCIMP